MTIKKFSTDEPIAVEVTRSGRREAVHSAMAVCCDSSGKILGHFGNPALMSYERSLAKPIQLLTAIKFRPSLLDECSDEEIAIMSASHSGEHKHIEIIRGLLKRYGIDEKHLLCGTHPPFLPQAVWELGRKNITITAVYHNCSGKHVGMLLACMEQGWPFEGYNLPDHPMQIANTETMARYAGGAASTIEYGSDGCGVVTWWLDLRSVALASARFADPEFGDDFEVKVRDRIFTAYHNAPWYTAGTERFGTDFNGESDGKWLGKIGGEGIFGVCFRDRAIGICIKIIDGNSRALGPSLLYAMQKWDLIEDDQLSRLSGWAKIDRINAPGTHIGYVKVVE